MHLQNIAVTLILNFGSSTVCAKTRRKIEKTERRNENTVYSEKLRLSCTHIFRGNIESAPEILQGLHDRLQFTEIGSFHFALQGKKTGRFFQNLIHLVPINRAILVR